MINVFVVGLLCGWGYVSVVVPMYQVAKPMALTIAQPEQCTLKIGKVLVQGDKYNG